jgi:hypothetical protein
MVGYLGVTSVRGKIEKTVVFRLYLNKGLHLLVN